MVKVKQLPLLKKHMKWLILIILFKKNRSGEHIKISIDRGSGRCLVELKSGYNIDFTKDDTFRDILGLIVK